MVVPRVNRWKVVGVFLALAACGDSFDPTVVCACSVLVDPTSVTISPAVDTIMVGESTVLTVTQAGPLGFLPGFMDWRAEPDSVLTVSSSANSGATGTATITGLAPGTGTANVTVERQGDVELAATSTVVVIAAGPR